MHCKDWCWSWNSNALATWCKELTHWKTPWCWERSKAGGEGDDRGWDGWMASPTQWTWVWVGSRSCWWTGTPGVLQSMGLQRVRHDWATELNPISWNCVSRSQPIPFHTTEPRGLMGCQLYSDIYLQGSFWCIGTWNQERWVSPSPPLSVVPTSCQPCQFSTEVPRRTIATSHCTPSN